MNRIVWSAALCLFVLAGCAPSGKPAPQGAPEPAPAARVERLDNGLTVIVAANHVAPVVCVRAYVRAGGLYEREFLGCGLSHLVEHLVAKGAVHGHGPGGGGSTKSKSSRVDRIGGQSNAYTSLAHTCYYIAAGAGRTDECIDLIADWMARPAFTTADFQREHGVVQRELEMGRDDPSRQMWYAHARNFFGTHPAGVPVIGYPEPLAKVTEQDVRAYHRRMYVPRNMVFVVVGDVNAEKVLARARRALSDFPAGRVPDLSLPDVPAIAKTRRVEKTNKALTDAMEYLSFRSVPLAHEDLYALDVLSYVLAHGGTSRLVRTVQRRDRLVTSISSSSWTPAWGAGQFTISFRCKPALADKAEAAILAELGRVAAAGVTAEELARAKRQKVADFVYSQQTVESQAATLASDYLSAGDVGFSRRYTQRIQDVTAGQVQAAARKYFDFDRMAITRMLPEGRAASQPTTRRAAGRGDTQLLKMPNGLRVVLHATPAVDLVSMAMVTRGGLLLETPQTNGLGTLMTALSTRGAGARSAEQIAALFARSGGNVGADCGNNTFYWQATVLADSADKVLPVFADIVCRPTYAKKELDIIRPSLLAKIRSSQETWWGELSTQWRRDFFGRSPLAMQSAGSEAVVAKATRDAIADYHRRHVKAGASVLAIYGNFDPASMRARVERLFAAMPSGDNAIPAAPAVNVPAAGRTHVHQSKGKGAGIIVAAAGMDLSNLKDRLAITVLDTIISGYRLPRGWLHEELRGRRLVYVVHAYNWAALVPGAFVTYAQCEPANAAQVADLIRKNLRRTCTHAFTQAEVDEAANIILTADLLGNQQMSALAMQAALDEVYGFGYDFRRRYEKMVRAVTPAEVSRVAKKYLSGGLATTIVTARPEAAKAEADK